MPVYRELPFVARLILSPLANYTRYGKFPWQMCIHILIVVLSSIELLRVNSLQTAYLADQY